MFNILLILMLPVNHALASRKYPDIKMVGIYPLNMIKTSLGYEARTLPLAQ